MKRNMTEEKILKRFDYYGLGFKVVLENVPMFRFEDEWVPKVDFNRLEAAMAVAVPLKAGRLSGHEARFLRLHLEFSTQELAEKLGIDCELVEQWEASGDQPGPMNQLEEAAFRQFVLMQQGMSNKEIGMIAAAIVGRRPRSRAKRSYHFAAQSIPTPKQTLRECLAAA